MRIFQIITETPSTTPDQQSFQGQLVYRDENKTQLLLKNIPAIKTSTREEILKRILAGKDYIDTCYLKNPEIRIVAIESNMSEFHFFRSFKQVMGISPYQYMLARRLQHGKTLLNEKNMLISEIACQCGFPDVFTFSKAFKKKFGYSPSKYTSTASGESC